MKQSKTIDVRISYLRIFATLTVVFLHTCSTVVSNPEQFTFTAAQGKFLLLGSKLLRFAVPVFFLISGKLLLGSQKKLTYKMTFEKYVRRIVLALAFFGIPFAVIKTYLELHAFSPIAIIKAFVCNESFSHLWYLYTLVAVYLILPLLKSAVHHVSGSTLLIGSVCMLIFSYVIPLISHLTGWKIAFEIAAPYPIFYFIVGYYISKLQEPKDAKWMHASVAVIIVSIAAITIIILAGIDTEYLCSYDSPIIALYSVAIYYLSQNLKVSELSEKHISVIWKIDRLCFGVYLIHPVFIQFVYRMVKIDPCSFRLYPLAAIVFFAVFTILSFAVSFIMQLIPWLRKNVL